MNTKLQQLEQHGCDISGSLPRFLDDEEFMLECIEQVLADPAFTALGGYLDRGDVKNAFDAAHTLKGIIANTGLTPLYGCIVSLVEPLRKGAADGLGQYYARLIAAREALTALLR